MDNKPKAYSYIRFSTTEQKRGDSLRRQESEAKKYAEEHGLILDEEQKLKDHGISGYKGFNRIKGALNDFLNLVEMGNIPKGSVLIVEHLDRLSREKVSDALPLFLNIINNGIKIVTTHDGMEYDKESIDKNTTQLFISITLMTAAHDESKKKSIRIRKALEEKREKLRKKELRRYSTKCPLWLKLSDDKTEFDPIEDACKAIELIFKKRLEGKGSYKIEKELNADPDVWKPPISSRNKSGGWRDAYISKILRNRKLIGEYQPHEMETKTIIKNGKEKEIEIPVAKGDPIKDYYPKVIDEGLFYRAQELINQNSKFPGNGGGGGNKDKGNNLFSHVVKCGICGSSMQFVDKGIQYLICDSRRRKNKVSIDIKKDQKQIDAKIAAKLNRRKIPDLEVSRTELVCTAKSVRYDEFERIFFENFDELDINKLLPDEDETTKLIKQKENELAKNKYNLDEFEKQLDYSARMVISKRDKESQQRFDKLHEETKGIKAELEAENKILSKEIENLTKQHYKISKQRDNIKEAHSFLKPAKDNQELAELRLRLRHEIQSMFEWIKIYPLQDKYVEYDEVEPGIIQLVKSKYIKKLRYKFRNIHLHGYGGALYLKDNIDIQEGY